ncbi:MAG: hypothetical protein GQ474_07215 [Sulfurimonas sp.]|nr:hypothetical protein [Sulfurimonas sp.]
MKKIEKNDKQLIAQSRMAQMGELIRMIAHQWRQPLASISSISSTWSFDVMMYNYKKEFFTDRLNSIPELTQHLSTTIDDFRNFYKPNKQKEITEIKTIVNDSISIIYDTLKSKGIKI